METAPQLQFLDERLCFALYSSSKAVMGAYQPYLAEMGITYPQYLVCIALFEKGEMNVRELGAILFLDSGTLTPLLKRMEAAELVTRRRNPEDDRKVLIRLTGKAKSLSDGIAIMQREVSQKTCLQSSDFQNLKKLLQELNLRMRDIPDYQPS